MKRTIAAASLGLIDTLVGTPVEIEINGPGIVRGTMLSVKQTSLVVASPDAPQVTLVPTILFEIDPDAPKKKRTFAILPVNKTIESQNQLEYRGHFLYPDGNIFFLYEEMDVPEDVLTTLKNKYSQQG